MGLTLVFAVVSMMSVSRHIQIDEPVDESHVETQGETQGETKDDSA